MKKNYSKEISLICPTCGGSGTFEMDEQTRAIKCKKCNRIFYGGYDELVELNQQRIGDEIDSTTKEISKDFQKEFVKIFKKSGFKVK